MDESVVKHLESPVKTLKLSEAIRIGIPLVKGESPLGWCGCAIGAAHFALTGKLFLSSGQVGGIVERWAKSWGFDPLVARQAEERFNLSLDHSETADWLEAQGY